MSTPQHPVPGFAAAARQTIEQAFATATGPVAVPLVTGTGRIHEKAAIDALVARGVDRGRILYVGDRRILKDLGAEFGVDTISPFNFARKEDLGGYEAVFVGDMFPEDRTRVGKRLEGYTGTVLMSTPIAPAKAARPDALAAITPAVSDDLTPEGPRGPR